MGLISVLISVYEKDNPDFLRMALDSILRQTWQPYEVILVKDGPLSDGLENEIATFGKKCEAYSVLCKVHALPQNQGLGIALREGLGHCTGDFIARMDADDISYADRLETQYLFLQEYSDIVAVGSAIDEFIVEGEILRTKFMPTTFEKLYQYAKFRNPLNHMSVMFRKEDIVEVGSYQDFKGLEDYFLWIRLLVSGKKIANIGRPLVAARLGDGFEKRRGGYKYFKNYVRLRKEQKRLGFTNAWEYLKGNMFSALITLMPPCIRKKIYAFIRR